MRCREKRVMIAVADHDGRSASTRAATSIAAPIRRRSEQEKLSLTTVQWLVDRSTGWIDRFAPCLRQRTSCGRHGAFLSPPRADRPTVEDERGCSSIVRWTRDRDRRVRIEPFDREKRGRRSPAKGASLQGRLRRQAFAPPSPSLGEDRRAPAHPAHGSVGAGCARHGPALGRPLSRQPEREHGLHRRGAPLRRAARRCTRRSSWRPRPTRRSRRAA